MIIGDLTIPNGHYPSGEYLGERIAFSRIVP